jgi:gamma-glutamyl-gamma-aminobutyrate hydrolase PuuD
MVNKQTTFCSIYDGDYGGSMAHLLQNEGMINVNPENLLEVDIIVFNGGEDIATSIYNENPIYTHQKMPSIRDKLEIDIFNSVRDAPKLKVGICRGAQLLNCLNGGSLWQDVNNHEHDHDMTVLEMGVIMKCTSTHHQMMIPGKDAIILAIANESTLKRCEYAEIRGKIKDDIEIVYYPNTHSLCIQGHPEYVPNTAFASYCIGLMVQYLAEITNLCAA